MIYYIVKRRSNSTNQKGLKMTDHNFNLNNINTIEEALQEMDYQLYKMEGLSSLAKRNRFFNMVAIYHKFRN